MKTPHRLVYGKKEKHPEKAYVYNLSIRPKYAGIAT